VPTWETNQILFQIHQGYHDITTLGVNSYGFVWPTKTKSLSGNHFAFVLVDDFSRFTWVFFLEHKNQAFLHF